MATTKVTMRATCQRSPFHAPRKAPTPRVNRRMKSSQCIHLLQIPARNVGSLCRDYTLASLVNLPQIRRITSPVIRQRRARIDGGALPSRPGGGLGMLAVVGSSPVQEGAPMKSPFPGMDPYIEACRLWRDFHSDLINEIKRALAVQLPRRFRLRTDERSYVELVETEGKTATPFYPDVGVMGPQAGRTPPEASPAVTEAELGTEPVSLRAFIAEEFREKFLEITVDDPERRLVTCIEVLSPSNR